jgi:membrane fusion protein (multidrug efflux system)
VHKTFMNAATQEAGTLAATARRIPLLSRRTLLASGIAVAAAIGGAMWIAAAPSRVSTDDAYVGADTTAVAPRVRGFVAEVYVRDNQPVHVGDPLVQVDPEEFDARLAAARASLADSEAGVESAKAALVSLAAEERLSSAQIVAARTSIRSAQAQSERARADRQRYAALVATGAVARSDADTYTAAAITAEQDAARANAMLVVASESAGVIHASRAGLLAALATAQARVEGARSALELANQDRRHTLIVAPIDGVIGNRQVRVGDYLQPGTHLLEIVPLHTLYVTANFKETQTGRMRVGQPVTIKADALPGERLHGTVESLAPGSGSSFSLLPFEPGTGNFTKIVQRVGVRIRFDPDQREVQDLRPGLSVTATVRLREAR